MTCTSFAMLGSSQIKLAASMQAFLHPSQEKILSGAAAKPSASMFSHLPAASSSSLYGRVTPLWRGVGEPCPSSFKFKALAG